MISMPIVSLLLGSAHYLRSESYGTVLTLLLLIPLLFSKYSYHRRFVQLIIFALSLMWLNLGFNLASMRIAQGLPYLRLSLIMLGVFSFTLCSSYLVGRWIIKEHRIIRNECDHYQLMVMGVIFFLLLLSSLAPFQLMLLPRFFASGASLQALLMALYAGHVFSQLQQHGHHSMKRLRLWMIFSLVFFGQLILGLFVDSKFLMTGKLHWPIPGLIISANILELKFSVMFVILTISFILAGPSWCSHLCYVGAIDHWLSTKRKSSTKIRQLSLTWRYFFLLLFIIIPIIYLLIGAPTLIVASTLGIVIILSLVFFAYSYTSGKMQHCSLLCPIGTVHSLLAKLHPYRIAIGKNCDRCLKCIKTCPYRAIDLIALEKHQAHANCTLCLECLDHCHQHSLTLARGKKAANKKSFLAIIAILHVLFLAFARI